MRWAFNRRKRGGKRRDNIDRFIDHVSRLSKGVHQKKDVFQAIGITTNYNRILTDARVKALLPTDTGLGIINVNNKSIEKLTDPIDLPDE